MSVTPCTDSIKWWKVDILEEYNEVTILFFKVLMQLLVEAET